jgi:hypothetical protein
MLGDILIVLLILALFSAFCTVVAQQKLGLCSSRRGGVDSSDRCRPSRCRSHLNHALPRRALHQWCMSVQE